jgi:transposase
VPPDDLPPLPPASKPYWHSMNRNGPQYDARALLYQLTGVDLCAISGLNESTIQTIISEIGTDMSHFPTEKHFCSWLGLAPHNDISGGKVLRSHTLKTQNRAGQAFRMAAYSISRNPNTAFGAFFRRMRSRLGPKQAIVATAHKIARTFYHMLKHRIPYHDLGGEEYERRARERELRNLEKRAAKLGMAITPSTAAASQVAVSW